MAPMTNLAIYAKAEFRSRTAQAYEPDGRPFKTTVLRQNFLEYQ